MKIDQCLFGYDDGHRLLASSLRLNGEVSFELTHVSDLVPTARFGASDGYWTGLPVPSLQRYVLMKTWPAPEMPRPGCVWTHALLIDPSLFEFLDELTVLRSVMRRPRGPNDRDFYRSTVDPDISFLRSEIVPYTDQRRASEVFEVLYGTKSGIVRAALPAEFDEEIFAIWSQQWPRLRRNFRFQTAVSADASAVRIPFDVQFQFLDVSVRPTSDGVDESWIEAAVQDLNDPQRSLRRFLWRYGADVKRQRGSFKPLCDVYITSRRSEESHFDAELIGSMHSSFPDVEDALLLKADIVNGELFGRHQIDILRYLVEGNLAGEFPALDSNGLNRFKALWPEHHDEMLMLADIAVQRTDKLAVEITAAVARAIPVSDFWSVTERYRKLRLRLVVGRPELLDDPYIKNLSWLELSEIIDALPSDVSVGKSLVRNLLSSADLPKARVILEKYPEPATEQIIDSTNIFGWHQLANPWWTAVIAEPTLILNVSMMSRIGRWSVLYRLAERFGWVSSIVLKFGLEPWSVATENAANDLDADDDLVFRSFLMALALQKGGPEAPDVIQKCFAPIHDRILRTYLPWRAAEILLDRLPSAGWARSWDTALRLRLAVVEAFVENGFDPQKFALLSNDKRVRRLLQSTAEEIDGGDQYAYAIGI